MRVKVTEPYARLGPDQSRNEGAVARDNCLRQANSRQRISAANVQAERNEKGGRFRPPFLDLPTGRIRYPD